MSQREITLPEPLKIGAPPADGKEDTRDSFGVPQLLLWAINSQPAFNQTGPGIRAAVRIEKPCLDWLNAPADDKPETLRIEDDAWKLAKEALEAPAPGADGNAYPFQPTRVLLPLIDAVATAREV